MKKKAFTLIELIAVLVILAILALIVTPLVMNIIRKAKISARKRSVDAYGRSIELAIASYLLDNGTFPSDISQLTIEYSGSTVECETTQMNPDSTVYLKDCTVGGKSVDYEYGEDKKPIPSAVETLIEKSNSVTVTNYTDANTAELYTFQHEATEQTESLTDYRYIGATPNNYVYFNGDELWRIIGVFTVEDESGNQEQRLKILRNEKLSSEMQWNSNSENEWSTATLNTYLNGDYYNELSSESKSMVVDTKYYLGGSSRVSITNYGTAPEIYAWERGTTTYDSSRSTNWIGKIGLIYPSDNFYIYALGVDNTCYNDGYSCVTYRGGVPTNGWIYNTNGNSEPWLLSPDSSYKQGVFCLIGSSWITSYYAVIYKSVRPSLYLASSVKIYSGDGSEQNPYQLSM